MKRQIALLLTGMLLGGMLLNGSVHAQAPTTEERLQRLESVVNGGIEDDLWLGRPRGAGIRIDREGTLFAQQGDGIVAEGVTIRSNTTKTARTEIKLRVKGNRLLARFGRGPSQIIADFSD